MKNPAFEGIWGREADREREREKKKKIITNRGRKKNTVKTKSCNFPEDLFKNVCKIRPFALWKHLMLGSECSGMDLG